MAAGLEGCSGTAEEEVGEVLPFEAEEEVNIVSFAYRIVYLTQSILNSVEKSTEDV